MKDLNQPMGNLLPMKEFLEKYRLFLNQSSMYNEDADEALHRALNLFGAEVEDLWENWDLLRFQKAFRQIDVVETMPGGSHFDPDISRNVYADSMLHAMLSASKYFFPFFVYIVDHPDEDPEFILSHRVLKYQRPES